MPTFERPAANVDGIQTVRRALAQATSFIDHPRQIYAILGSLTPAVASLSRSAHRPGDFHDREATMGVAVMGDACAEFTALHRVSWEHHGPERLIHPISERIASAHDAEAQVVYSHRDSLVLASPPLGPVDQHRTVTVIRSATKGFAL